VDSRLGNGDRGKRVCSCRYNPVWTGRSLGSFPSRSNLSRLCRRFLGHAEVGLAVLAEQGALFVFELTKWTFDHDGYPLDEARRETVLACFMRLKANPMRRRAPWPARRMAEWRTAT